MRLYIGQYSNNTMKSAVIRNNCTSCQSPGQITKFDFCFNHLLQEDVYTRSNVFIVNIIQQDLARLHSKTPDDKWISVL